MKELFGAMALAFPEIEGALKDSENPAFKNGGKVLKYADLASVVGAVKPALTSHDLFFVQMTHEQAGGVCIETVVGHKSGEQFSFGKLFVPASKNDAQGYGSALTYARRYSLMAAFGVCPEDDDGNAAVRSPSNDGERSGPEPRQKLEGPITSKTALKQAVHAVIAAVRGAETVEAIDALKEEHKRTINQARRDWPELIDGDPKLPEDVGLAGAFAARREELTAGDAGMYGELIRSMKECETIKSFTAWNATNEVLIDGLNDIDRRRFERERDQFESGLSAVARRNAG